MVPPLAGHEGAESIRDLDDGDIFGAVDMIESRNKHLAILGDDAHAFRKDGPGVVDPVVDCAGNFILFRIARHLEPGRQRKESLGRKDRVQPLRQPLFGGRVEAVAIQVRSLKPAVVKQHRNFARPKVPECRRISGNTLPDPVASAFRMAVTPQSRAAFADPKAKAVAAAQIVMMAGPTRDIAVSRQYLVIEQQLADLRLGRIHGQKICVRQRAWQINGMDWQRKAKGEDMKQTTHSAILAILLALATPAVADIEGARDLMEAGKFAEAREALLPFARSGNADAEELIGVMYALGLGVEKDPERAFEWYLRSSMKGHPGAQSGIGWYYELGIGMPAPDLVRAYLWYALSSIGGDPDAVDSLEQLQNRMTKDEIARAQVLVNDYKPWMYPFR